MTYKEVLDDIIDLLQRHRMIVTWGYGNLSDLVSPFKKLDAATTATGVAADVYNIDYPYAFLQPTNHSLQKGKTTFNFNLIMMTQCDDAPEAVIQAQSNCYQYIKDVLAELYYNYDQKYDFTINSQVTPFKEKYNDTVSGMTANISIEIPTILDDCIAPFAPKPDNLLIWVAEADQQELGTEVGEDNVIAARTIIRNDSTFGTWDVNRYDATATTNYRIEVTANIKVAAGTGNTIPLPFQVHELGGGDPQAFTPADVVQNWPTDIQGDYTALNMVWNNITIEGPNRIAFASLSNSGGDANLLLENVEIKFFSL